MKVNNGDDDGFELSSEKTKFERLDAGEGSDFSFSSTMRQLRELTGADAASRGRETEEDA